MATTPMQSGDAGAMDPEDQADGGADEGLEQDSGDSGYLICIHVAGDGTLSVGVETDQEEADETSEETPDQETADYSPAKDFKDAIAQATAIYKNKGQVGGDDRMSVEQAFQGGFGGTSAGNGA